MHHVHPRQIVTQLAVCVREGDKLHQPGKGALHCAERSLELCDMPVLLPDSWPFQPAKGEQECSALNGCARAFEYNLIQDKVKTGACNQQEKCADYAESWIISLRSIMNMLRQHLGKKLSRRMDCSRFCDEHELSSLPALSHILMARWIISAQGQHSF